MGMLYVEAPEDWQRSESDGPGVFLAGGITACEDWQAEVRELMTDDPVTLLNPRRVGFDVTRGDSAAQQVEWEFRHLHKADVTLFWFPACDPSVTVQPIAMFELGAATNDPHRVLVVGADPAYPRRADIDLQLGHIRPDLTVHESLDEVVTALRNHLP